MAPETGHDAGEANQNTVFIDTSLDTHLATLVSHSDTVSELKKKITMEHRQCFPAIGDIKIHCLKVKRRGNFYHLSDSLLVKSAFSASKKNWFVSVDASRLEQHGEVQNLSRPNVGDQLALPWVTDISLIDRHDTDKPSKPSLGNGSPSIHPKIVPFVNQRVSSVDQFTSGESCKDVSKNMEEDRSSNDYHWRIREADLEKLDTITKEIKAMKRVRDVHNEGSLVDALESGPSAKKKCSSRRIELKGTVKASEGDIVLTHDTGKVNDQSSVEHKSESKNVTLDGEATEPLRDKHTRTMSVSHHQKKMKKINRINKDNDHSGHDQLATVLPTSVSDVGEETLSQINTEASEIMPEVAVVMEQNIQQEKEKCDALVQKAVIGNDIPSLTMGTSDCEPQLKLPERSKRKKAKKPAAKNKDESQVKHSSVPNPVFDDKIIDERKNDDDKIIDERKNEGVSLSCAERNEVSEKQLMDDSLVYASKKSDDMIGKEVEISETESHKNHVHAEDMEGKSRNEFKDNMGSKKKKKDVAKSASRNDESVVKHANNIATGTNEETFLPHTERKENIEITANNDNMDNEVEISRTERNESQVNVKDINDKMDGTKKNKKKRKTKKSAAINEDELVMKHANDPSLDDYLHENVNEGKINLPDNERGDIFNEKLSDNKDIKQHPLPEETSKNMKESKRDNHNIDNQVDIPKGGSNEVHSKHYLVPDQQQNEVVSASEKKPKKKTKEQYDSRIDGAVLSQKSFSKNENKKDSNLPNVDQIKTPKKTRKIDVSRPSKSAHASKRDNGPSSESASRSLGQNNVETSKKTVSVMNNSQNVKSWLNKPGVIFGDGSGESSADDNASVNSDSSTHTPSAKSSSTEESDSSIDSKRNGSYATKRKEGGGKNGINSQSRMKNISMVDLLRSSSRFKKARLTASKRMEDTESQPVDFVPESQPTC